jgi:hypothetical protein
MFFLLSRETTLASFSRALHSADEPKTGANWIRWMHDRSISFRIEVEDELKIQWKSLFLGRCVKPGFDVASEGTRQRPGTTRPKLCREPKYPPKAGMVGKV